MRKAVIPEAKRHAFVGGRAAFSELCTVDETSGTRLYRTRCGLYVPPGCLVEPGSPTPTPCKACQAAREGRP